MRRLLILMAIPVCINFAAHAQSKGDADKGKKLFRECAFCHSSDPNEKRIGPSLAGVFGRKAGEAYGFDYSKSLKDSAIVWNDDTLNQYLENPQQVITGARASFTGVRNSEDRLNIIAYLKTLR